MAVVQIFLLFTMYFVPDLDKTEKQKSKHFDHLSLKWADNTAEHLKV